MEDAELTIMWTPSLLPAQPRGGSSGRTLLTLPRHTERTLSTSCPVSSWKALQRFISWSHSFTAPPSLVLKKDQEELSMLAVVLRPLHGLPLPSLPVISSLSQPPRDQQDRPSRVVSFLGPTDEPSKPLELADFLKCLQMPQSWKEREF